MTATISVDTTQQPALAKFDTPSDTTLVAELDNSVASGPSSGKDTITKGPLPPDEAVHTLPVAPTGMEAGQGPVFRNTPESKATQPQPPRPQTYREKRDAERKFLGAIKTADLDVIKSVVHQHDRVLCTQALGRAVDQQNIAVVKVLLENGVKCDFEESDRPRPIPAYPSHGWFHYDPAEPEEDKYIPPLVRAVNLGNINLVRLLVAHGADINVGYHDLRHELSKSLLFCGRPVQLAMALKHMDIVDFLLESGADINLNHPVWYHECPRTKGKILRAVHLRVRAGLRAEVRRLEMEIEKTSDTK